MPTVGAVMVLFHPDPDLLAKALEALVPQVDKLIIVDNTPDTDNSPLLPPSEKIQYIPLKENKGIAAAQNRGILALKEAGNIDFVVLSDQDSVAHDGLIRGLMNGYRLLAEKGKVLAVGPTPINRQTSAPCPLGSCYEAPLRPTPVPHVSLRQIMASFSLTPLSRYDEAEVGPLSDHLFIDGVDSEWFWRGYEKYGDSVMLADLKVEHELGTYKKILGRPSNISSPFRLYYQIRNYLWLRRLPYTPQNWKKRNFTGTIIKSVCYPLFFAPRLKYLRSVAKGLYDGFTQKL